MPSGFGQQAHIRFGVWGLGFGVWGLGFGVWGLGFGVGGWGLGVGGWGLGFGVWVLGFGVWGLGFGVWGFWRAICVVWFVVLRFGVCSLGQQHLSDNLCATAPSSGRGCCSGWPRFVQQQRQQPSPTTPFIPHTHTPQVFELRSRFSAQGSFVFRMAEVVISALAAVIHLNRCVVGGGGRGRRHMLFVTRHTSHVTRHTSHVTRHTSHVTLHTSHVTRHTSHVTRHTSHVTRHTSLQRTRVPR